MVNVANTVSSVQQTVSAERTGLLAWVGAHKTTVVLIGVGLVALVVLFATGVL